MKNWTKLFAVLLIAAGLTGCYDRPKEEQKPQTPAEAPKPVTPPAETPAPGSTPPPAPGGAPGQTPPAAPAK